MNVLRSLSNDRRVLRTAAVMAGIFFLFVGGANAAVLTQRCVPKHTINPNCSATDYPTISAAVAAAVSGDIILVAPGTYNEAVTINTDSLFLFGAQAGRDAREGRDNLLKESVVDATGTGNPTITINAPYVTVDGFTIRGGTSAIPYSAGVFIEPGPGMQVLNNVIEANGTGIFTTGINGSVIERNLIKNNNTGTGLVVGCGVAALGPVFLSVSDNEFSGNQAAAIAVLAGFDVTIRNNTSMNDGSFVVFLSTAASVFSHNRGRNFGAKGVLPVSLLSNPGTNADAAVDIALGNQILEISDNDLQQGEDPISHGIAFTTVFGSSSVNTGVIVKGNEIKGFKGNGIVAETDTTVNPTMGMAIYSSIVGNEADENGQDGIFIQGADTNNSNLSLFDNQALGNRVFDCQDTSLASGPSGYTLGTHDTWFNNLGNLNYPTGLCTPGHVGHH